MSNEYERVPLNQPVLAVPYQQAAYQQAQPVYFQPIPHGQGLYGVPVANHGMWHLGIFDCFNSCTNALKAFFCPCVSLAQISSRLGTFGGYCGVLLSLLVLIILRDTFSGLYNIEIGEMDEQEEWTPQGFKRHQVVTYGIISAVASLIITLLITSLRTRVRRIFHIHGNECEDFICSYCCSCCVIAQLSSQLQIDAPGQCSFGPRETLPAYTIPVPTLV